MRIDPSNGLTTGTGLSGVSSQAQKVAAPKTNESATSTPTTETSFAPTSDLQRLLDAVKQTPDVRQDVVADVTQRYAAGELETRQAAVDTAAAINEQQ